MSNKKELENLLKLKQAIINDLKKQGKVIENKAERKKIELSDRLKKREERVLLVDFSKVYTIRDIDSQDYDAPDSLVIEKLKSYLSGSVDPTRVELLSGLLKILEFNFKEALNILQESAYNGDSKAAYSYAESLLFLGKYTEALNFISQFTKTFQPDFYTYLSILEMLVYFFKDWERIEKLFNFFNNSSDAFSEILKLAYMLAKQDFVEARSIFTKAIMAGKYKNLLDIYSMIISSKLGEIEKAFQLASTISKRSKEHTCSLVHASYHKDQDYHFELSKMEFCPYARFLMAKKAFMRSNFKSVLTHLEPLIEQNYPSAFALAGTVMMFQRQFDEADSYWTQLSKLVPFEIVIGTSKKPLRSNVEKLSEDIEEKNRVQVVNSGTAKTLYEILSSSNNMGFKLVYPEIEYLRLFFGERTCKRMYRRGESFDT